MCAVRVYRPFQHKTYPNNSPTQPPNSHPLRLLLTTTPTTNRLESINHPKRTSSATCTSFFVHILLIISLQILQPHTNLVLRSTMNGLPSPTTSVAHRLYLRTHLPSASLPACLPARFACRAADSSTSAHYVITRIIGWATLQDTIPPPFCSLVHSFILLISHLTVIAPSALGMCLGRLLCADAGGTYHCATVGCILQRCNPHIGQAIVHVESLRDVLRKINGHHAAVDR